MLLNDLRLILADVVKPKVSFTKIGSEKGRDFQGKWKSDMYDVQILDLTLQLTVKNYGEVATVNLFGASENVLNTQAVRAIVGFIKKKYPKIYVIEGQRISGARKSKLFNRAQLRLRPDTRTE